MKERNVDQYACRIGAACAVIAILLRDAGASDKALNSWNEFVYHTVSNVIDLAFENQDGTSYAMAMEIFDDAAIAMQIAKKKENEK